MSDDEVRELALQMKREMGRVPVEVLRQAARGGHKRISRILREVNADASESSAAASPAGVDEADPGSDIPRGVREAVDQLLGAVRQHLRQAAAESDSRARASEQALIARQESAITASEGLRLELESYLDELGAALAVAEEQRDAVHERAEDLQRRLTESEEILVGERQGWTTERHRLEQELGAAQQAERRSTDALHSADVEKNKAETALRTTQEALEAMREEWRRLGDRCSALQASRAQYHHEARAGRAKLDDLQRELDAERTTNRRLEQLLASQLGKQASAPKPATPSKKPNSKRDGLRSGT